jgi:DNA replication protein DnaC
MVRPGTYLACALGQAACRQVFSVRYRRSSRLLHEIMISHTDWSISKMLRNLARLPLLILDDWARGNLPAAQARDLLEIVDDRNGQAFSLMATQVLVHDWPARFSDPTVADAILDRLLHDAYRLELKGGSMRKTHSPLVGAMT